MHVTNANTDIIEVVTSAAVNVDVTADWVDVDAAGSTAPAAGSTPTAITTAATTTVVATPAASKTRIVKVLDIRNKGASADDITVQFDRGGTNYEKHKVTLQAGEALIWTQDLGFFVLKTSSGAVYNQSTSTVSAGFASDTYLAGSSVAIPTTIKVGTRYRLTFDMVKTGAGTATPIVTVRFGTAGTTGDTARCTFTFNAGTANADTGKFVVELVFRSVGSGTSAVLAGSCALTKGATATTGLVNLVGQVVTAVSGGFDSTVASSLIGASFNGGTSFSGTLIAVQAELVNS